MAGRKKRIIIENGVIGSVQDLESADLTPPQMQFDAHFDDAEIDPGDVDAALLAAAEACMP